MFALLRAAAPELFEDLRRHRWEEEEGGDFDRNESDYFFN